MLAAIARESRVSRCPNPKTKIANTAIGAKMSGISKGANQGAALATARTKHNARCRPCLPGPTAHCTVHSSHDRIRHCASAGSHSVVSPWKASKNGP